MRADGRKDANSTTMHSRLIWQDKELRLGEPAFLSGPEKLLK